MDTRHCRIALKAFLLNHLGCEEERFAREQRDRRGALGDGASGWVPDGLPLPGLSRRRGWPDDMSSGPRIYWPQND
jgi:hypothetical protein